MKQISVESFNNTELAFAAKSDWQLKKAYYLFRIVNNNTMASIATFSATLGLNLHLPIKGIIKKTVFEHFCGGETILECKTTSDKMAEYNVGSILDYSVEGKDSEEAFDNALSETLQTIENAKENPAVPYCVFKPTGLGSSLLMGKVQLGENLTDSEKDAFDRIKNRYDVLSKAAFDNNVRLLIDAEDSWYQETIDDLLYELMEKYNKTRAIVFNTYQMYRWESLENIKKAHQMVSSNPTFEPHSQKSLRETDTWKSFGKRLSFYNL
jgi:proline dehydrogenase